MYPRLNLREVLLGQYHTGQNLSSDMFQCISKGNQLKKYIQQLKTTSIFGIFFFFTLFLPYSLLYFKAKLMHGMVKQGNFRNTKEWHHPMVVFSRTFFPSDLCHWQVHPIFWLTLTSFLSVEIPTIIIFSKNFMEGGREKKTLIDHVFFFFLMFS